MANLQFVFVQQQDLGRMGAASKLAKVSQAFPESLHHSGPADMIFLLGTAVARDAISK